MTIAEQIERDYIVAYKAKDAQRLGVLRLLKTAVKNQQIELRQSLTPLDDDAMLDIIQKQAKQRQDSIEQFSAANRADLADKEAAELVILKEYLPVPLTGEELAAAIEAAVQTTGASTMKDMGAVMQAVMLAHKGRVDGKQVSTAVRARLA